MAECCLPSPAGCLVTGPSAGSCTPVELLCQKNDPLVWSNVYLIKYSTYYRWYQRSLSTTACEGSPPYLRGVGIGLAGGGINFSSRGKNFVLQEGGRGRIELEKLLKRSQKWNSLGSRKFLKFRSPF